MAGRHVIGRVKNGKLKKRRENIGSIEEYLKMKKDRVEKRRKRRKEKYSIKNIQSSKKTPKSPSRKELSRGLAI